MTDKRCVACGRAGHRSHECPDKPWELPPPQPKLAHEKTPCPRCEHWYLQPWESPCKACLRTRPEYADFREKS